MINEELIKTYIEFKKECVKQGILNKQEIMELFKVYFESF